MLLINSYLYEAIDFIGCICVGRYVGDSAGDVSILRLHQEQCRIEHMKYRIPLSASHGIHSNSVVEPS